MMADQGGKAVGRQHGSSSLSHSHDPGGKLTNCIIEMQDSVHIDISHDPSLSTVHPVC